MDAMDDDDDSNERKVHTCPQAGCKAVFNRPYRLSEHLLVHFNFKAYQCPENNCTKSYTNKSHLNRHINTAHKTHETHMMYSCPSCMKMYANRQNLKRHIKEYHSPEATRVILRCDVCKSEFKTKNQLTAHMYVHTGIKSYICEICSKEFVTITEMKKHRRFHKTYECSECQKKFHSWATYQSHKLNDHRVDEYICNECGVSFKLRCYLVRHIKIHSYTRTYPCPYAECTRYYTRNSNLKQHIMVNHLQFTFDCTICNARLSTKAKLDYHLNLHNQPKKEKAKPKTRATGRKPRSDKGITRTSTAVKLAGLPETLVEVCME